MGTLHCIGQQGPYHRTQPAPGGQRWLVVHSLPGVPDAMAVDADCLTLMAAERERARLSAERRQGAVVGPT